MGPPSARRFLHLSASAVAGPPISPTSALPGAGLRNCEGRRLRIFIAYDTFRQFSAPPFFRPARKQNKRTWSSKLFTLFFPATVSIWQQTIQPHVCASFSFRLTAQPRRCGRFRRPGSPTNVPGSSPDVPGSPLGAPAAGLGFISNQILHPLP